MEKIAFVVCFTVVSIFSAVLLNAATVAGMEHHVSSYYIPPTTKVGSSSLSGNSYATKSVTSCVGACTSSGMRTQYSVSVSHWGFSWNQHNAYYDYR